jgi:hypothetical protein
LNACGYTESTSIKEIASRLIDRQYHRRKRVRSNVNNNSQNISWLNKDFKKCFIYLYSKAKVLIKKEKTAK